MNLIPSLWACVILVPLGCAPEVISTTQPEVPQSSTITVPQPAPERAASECDSSPLQVERLPVGPEMTPGYSTVIRLAETADGAAVVHTVQDPKWWVSEFVDKDGRPDPQRAQRGRFGVDTVGERGALRLELGRRWAYVAEVYINGYADVVLGDLSEPEHYTAVHASADHDEDPVLTVAHGGGWVVAWGRTPNIELARVSESGAVGERTEIEALLPSPVMELLKTPVGYALTYFEHHAEDEGLVVAFVDENLAPTGRVVLPVASWDDGAAVASADEAGLGIVYTHKGPGVAGLGFARVGFDGRIAVPPTSVWETSESLAAVGTGLSTLFHRGRYWVGFHVGFCTVRQACDRNARVFVSTVTPQGAMGDPVLLAEADEHATGPVLGRLGDDVLAAWLDGGPTSPMHRARIRCDRPIDVVAQRP